MSTSTGSVKFDFERLKKCIALRQSEMICLLQAKKYPNEGAFFLSALIKRQLLSPQLYLYVPN